MEIIFHESSGKVLSRKTTSYMQKRRLWRKVLDAPGSGKTQNDCTCFQGETSSLIEIRTQWGMCSLEDVKSETIGAIVTAVLSKFGMNRDPEKNYRLIKSDGEVLDDSKSQKVYLWKQIDYAEIGRAHV